MKAYVLMFNRYHESNEIEKIFINENNALSECAVRNANISKEDSKMFGYSVETWDVL